MLAILQTNKILPMLENEILKTDLTARDSINEENPSDSKTHKTLTRCEIRRTPLCKLQKEFF